MPLAVSTTAGLQVAGTLIAAAAAVASWAAVAQARRARAVVYGRSADNRDFVWNDGNLRRELPGGVSPMPAWEAIFGAFYDTEGLESLRPGRLLRGDNTLY